ncbi:MAG: phytoene/squalene synthase family protein [Candidatus Dormibacteraeota bacterium]|nr:phytoene/squalene synthase family protein [Candidatus Dormibacteraeota bacterium]
MSADPAELEIAYRACARQVRRSAANFYYAFQLLPAGKRRGLHSLYRFCRGADDIADGPGGPELRRQQLEDYRRALTATLAGSPPDLGWLTLSDTAARFQLPARILNDVIDGCAADCAPLEIRTEADLARYCYGVAGSVGLLSSAIFRYQDPAVPELAVRLGQAMQLTNILRDLKEDLLNGRCYLPLDDLHRYGLEPADLLAGGSGQRSSGYFQLMRHQVARARGHFQVGIRLVPLVERDARGCPAALAALYQTLLSELERRDFDVQTERISLSPARKVGLAAKAWLWASLAT